MGRHRLSNRVALEPIGESFKIDELKERLKKRFPNHNFNVPAPPDTKCKSPYLCKTNDIKYRDSDGNEYCGLRFKQTDENNHYIWEWKVCHAMIHQAKPVFKQDDIPF